MFILYFLRKSVQITFITCERLNKLFRWTFFDFCFIQLWLSGTAFYCAWLLVKYAKDRKTHRYVLLCAWWRDINVSTFKAADSCMYTNFNFTIMESVISAVCCIQVDVAVICSTFICTYSMGVYGWWNMKHVTLTAFVVNIYNAQHNYMLALR